MTMHWIRLTILWLIEVLNWNANLECGFLDTVRQILMVRFAIFVLGNVTHNPLLSRCLKILAVVTG